MYTLSENCPRRETCIQNGKGIRYLGKQGGAAGLGLLLGILQNGDGIARSIRRVKTGKPVMQQLPAVCIKLAGLSRAGFTGGGTGAIVTLDPQGAVQSVALACGS